MKSPFSFLKKIFDDDISPAEEPDAVEAEYRSVLEILETKEGDPEALGRALSEAVRLSDEVTGRLGSIF